VVFLQAKDLAEIPQELKTCTECEKKLSASNFYKKGKFLDSSCKTCVLKKKKCSYLSKKTSKKDSFKNIIIMPIGPEVAINLDELVDALEAFLVEEFEGGQAVSV
jgi:hypothetical protein